MTNPESYIPRPQTRASIVERVLKTGQGQRVLLAGERTADSSLQYLSETPQGAKPVSSFRDAEAGSIRVELLDGSTLAYSFSSD
ncbi:hypothetical protein TYRP_023668 [Tyrophagus putrescentiae]|nr:hypothetical protein TYRP_023668 [Tyrophagus putrescentiae]